MRPHHSSHSFPSFPIYSAAFLSEDLLVLGGGGGASKTGIKNKLRIYVINEDRTADLKDEYELEKGEDAPMSIATDILAKTLVCGVNSTVEKLEKGENENCRVFSVKDHKIKFLRTQKTIPSVDPEDYQKVTVLSTDGKLLAVAGAHDLSLLHYPSLMLAAEPIHTEMEIYDATFSSQTLVIATTHNLLVYLLPEEFSATNPSSKEEGKKKSNGSENSPVPLTLQHTIVLPASTGVGSTFRAVRYHPQDPATLYTAINTSSPRSRKIKSSTRQGYVCKWNTESWLVVKTRKIGDRGLTCLDISADGRFLAFGSSDLTIGMLEGKNLSPIATILKAHEFPPTTIKFNSTATLLVSGSADSSMRVVTVPDVAGSFSWTFLYIVLALLVILLAIVIR
ncbi:hypothetical protein K443DRAFT_672409 [Laccaria amethystina LaAM-08-1]|uniref:Unplaced genomic scaffold K443scaffold_7, whole genome shotgun sequence n=1 Tax=Laccaria amethystina LaAM-08-1 TaxID=1095629 RepID=A0A0C9XTW9_9AGAR|nr:hypothetical protein K443DRAFT_672409 [Laccaria amethystina LaAM-08-1]